MSRAERILEKFGEMSVRKPTGRKVGFWALSNQSKLGKINRDFDKRMQRAAKA